MEHMDIIEFNFWTKTHILDENRFDDNGNIIMKNYTNYKTTGVIAHIFEDNWDEYYKMYKSFIDIIRPNADFEVKKIIKCANHELGASVFVCPDCDEVYFCHHTCKGKLCSSCGIKTQKKITEKILETCLRSKHRHITFTIPEDLRNWFICDLHTTDILFSSVCETLYSTVNGKFKKNKRIYDLKFKPGFFAFLHTFGRPLNFNPHIHVIIAKNILNGNKFKKFNYFNYDALSLRFMTILLNKMEKYFEKEKFRTTKNLMYAKYKKGFYVNNRLEDDGYKFDSIEDLIKYVTRYCARPVIAESRILKYEDNNVTWCFVDHKTNKEHVVTECAFSFITRILRHLLPTHFKSIRSYGFYSKPSKLPEDTNMIVSKEKIPFRRKLIQWCNSIMCAFNRIPIKCPKCGTLMELSILVT